MREPNLSRKVSWFNSQETFILTRKYDSSAINQKHWILALDIIKQVLLQEPQELFDFQLEGCKHLMSSAVTCFCPPLLNNEGS